MKVVDLKVGEDYAVRPRQRPVLRGRLVAIKPDHEEVLPDGRVSVGTWMEFREFRDGVPVVAPTFHVMAKSIKSPWDAEVARRAGERRKQVQRLQRQQQSRALGNTLRDALQVLGFESQVNAAAWGGRVTVSVDEDTTYRLIAWLESHRRSDTG